MFNPVLVMRWLIAVTVGLALLWLAIHWMRGQAGRGFLVTAEMWVGVGLLFSSAAAVVAWVEARQFRRLQQGKDVLIRWKVTPELWAAFLQEETQLAAASPEYPHLIERDLDTWQDKEVIVGKDMIVIGDTLHRTMIRDANTEVIAMQLHEKSVTLCEMLLVIWHREGRYMVLRRHPQAIRFPVPQEHKAEMAAVLRKYIAVANAQDRHLPGFFRHAELMRRVCAVIGGFGVMLCILGLSVQESLGPWSRSEARGLGFIAGIVAMFAFAVAWAAHHNLKQKNKWDDEL